MQPYMKRLLLLLLTALSAGAEPQERHSTIYHPAALRAFRVLFAPK
jgi:hypothetical protein